VGRERKNRAGCPGGVATGKIERSAFAFASTNDGGRQACRTVARRRPGGSVGIESQRSPFGHRSRTWVGFVGWVSGREVARCAGRDQVGWIVARGATAERVMDVCGLAYALAWYA